MPQDRSDRPVVRVTKADGSVVNVRKEDLEKFVADNPGAVAEGGAEETPAAEENSEEGGDTVEEMGTTGRRRAS